MTNFMDAHSPAVGPRKDDHPADPQISHRTSICGDFDESTELRQLDVQEQWHSPIAFESFKEHSRAENCPVYIETRYPDCAIEVKDGDDKHQTVPPQMTPDSYQAGASSTYAGETGTAPRGEFDNVQERHKCSRYPGTATKLNPGVSEEKHLAHRLGVQAGTAACPGKCLAIPTKQAWDMTRHTTGGFGLEIYRRNVPPFSENEDKLVQSKVESEDGNTQGGVIPQNRRRSEPSSPCLEVGTKENKDTGDAVRVSAEIHSVDSARCVTLARTSNREERRFQSTITSSSPTSDAKLAKERNLFNVADLIGKNSDSSLFNRAIDAECHRAANTPALFARESALIDNLIAEYASLSDGDFDPSLIDTRYERPRAVPAVPEKYLLDSMKQRSSISTRALLKSKPVSRNFRRLRLDIQHSNRLIYKTQSDQESPDWACRTSLAIEAGKFSMDSVYTHRRDSKLRHILEAIRSPTKTYSPDRRRVQSFGLGGKETTYSAPSCRHIVAHPAAGRHSEGALQLVLRANSDLPVGNLEGMEIKIGQEPLRHDFLQAASPVDLNKSLPPLPVQICGQNGKE